MRFEFCSAIDAGRARSNNEDTVSLDEEAGLAILADGMGGYNAGEVASEMAASVVRRSLGAWLRSQPGVSAAGLHRAVADAAADANRAVHEAAASNAAYEGMGTTLVIAVFRDSAVFFGHVGDSRGYRWRAGRLEQLTRDHSLLQEQLDAGLITPEDAAASMNRNLVTRAVGVEPGVEIEMHDHAVDEGDIVLLCSDGLSDMLADDEIARTLRAGEPLATTAASLIDAANRAGGRDNISLVLVRASPAPAAPTKSWWPFRR